MDSFRARSTLEVGGKSYDIWRLAALKAHGDLARLPFSLKILLENLLRTEDGVAVTKADVLALLAWNPKAEPDKEIAFTPARVLMQDFTGVPAVVDLAAMRAAIVKLGGDPKLAARVNPLAPAELVIDHSVQVDSYGTPESFTVNAQLEASRNRERYVFLRWGQKAFRDFKVVPPDTGIVHQVNLENLARVVFVKDAAGAGAKGPAQAYPDTLVGTDSHTTMINGLGVLGFGVGGIEAEAALLGQPVSMLIPHVVGFKLKGKLAEGATATDLVLTATQLLRKKGVVGKFVEFHGDGIRELSLADRATLANMAPEYGATIGLFPIDEETIRYLKLTGRSAEQIALVEAYCKEQGLWWTPGAPEPAYSDSLELDLATVEPSLAGPKRPQDRVPLKQSKAAFATALAQMEQERAARLAAKGVKTTPPRSAKFALDGKELELAHGSVVIAAITSCTNTSNPSVMIAAGLLAKKARARGLSSRPWVKTSLAPGSQVVTEYLRKSGLLADLEALGFHVVGYGCTTCIGNSGPLKAAIGDVTRKNDLAVAAVLSGNRNFEGRVHPLVKMNYLASPPLVVAYALAGRADVDLASEPLGTGQDGRPVFLKDVWPTQKEVNDAVAASVTPGMFAATYASVYEGDDRWRSLPIPEGELYAWDPKSTYVKLPPYFEGMPARPAPVSDVTGARCLAVLGDSVTTDHISPAGDIPTDGPAGRYLLEHGVPKEEFNSYGARRGNHELMMRGTFANVRLKNLLAPGTEGGVTICFARGAPAGGAAIPIFDAAMLYAKERVPLVILAGKEYGSGSSRDWAAKGPRLLGVRVVIAESYERIHRSNLIGMGVLPLQFPAGQTACSLGLTGRETYDVTGLGDGSAKSVTITARPEQGAPIVFPARVRIDTPKEVEYFRHGGILQYVLRRMLT